jgi:hypothetical protein
MILAGLGEKDAAIAEGRRAVELTPESADAYDGPYLTASLAQIYAWVGEKDQAFRLRSFAHDPQRSHRPETQA